ncbi:MAG: AbrB/MazE/SpoVT family DNA-binding domain-containing protein [Nitrososphaerales archaeon]
MQSEQEPEIATVGQKGQIVIPQDLRKKLKITPKTKLLVYRRKDKLIISRLKVESLTEDLKNLFKEIDKESPKRRRSSEKETLREIQAYRDN